MINTIKQNFKENQDQKQPSARIKQYQKFFMTAAIAAGELSYAKRQKVGAVIVKNGRIISTGYNGTPSGEDNVCEYELPDGTLKTKPIVIHAETNAIFAAAHEGINTNNTEMYCVLSPCVNCALGIIQAGIKKCYYLEKYRDDAGIKLLEKCGVEVEQLDCI